MFKPKLGIAVFSTLVVAFVHRLLLSSSVLPNFIGNMKQACAQRLRIFSTRAVVEQSSTRRSTFTSPPPARTMSAPRISSSL